MVYDNKWQKIYEDKVAAVSKSLSGKDIILFKKDIVIGKRTFKQGSHWEMEAKSDGSYIIRPLKVLGKNI